MAFQGISPSGPGESGVAVPSLHPDPSDLVEVVDMVRVVGVGRMVGVVGVVGVV